jgi:hypothetical protein
MRDEPIVLAEYNDLANPQRLRAELDQQLCAGCDQRPHTIALRRDPRALALIAVAIERRTNRVR